MYLLTDIFRYLSVILILPNHGTQKVKEIFFKEGGKKPYNAEWLKKKQRFGMGGRSCTALPSPARHGTHLLMRHLTIWQVQLTPVSLQD